MQTYMKFSCLFIPPRHLDLTEMSTDIQWFEEFNYITVVFIPIMS